MRGLPCVHRARCTVFVLLARQVTIAPPKPPDATARWIQRAPSSLVAQLERLTGGELAAIAAASKPAPAGELVNREQRRAAGRVAQRHSSSSSSSPPPPPPRKRRKRGYVAELRAHWLRQQRWLDRHRELMRQRRGPEPEPPPALAIGVWRACHDVMYDLTGKAARVHLSRLRPVWRTAIRRAALGELAGECRRDWSSERARAIVCVGLVLCCSARRSKRRGTWTHCVRGYTRGLFVKVTQGARLRPHHLNTISGVHRPGADPLSGQMGYLQALKRAGLFYRQQLPAQHVEPWERWKGRDGVLRSANRYWLCNPDPYDGHLGDDVRRSLLELAAGALRSEQLVLRQRPRMATGVEQTAAGPPPPPD